MPLTLAVYITHLVAFHVSWLLIPHVNQDFHGKILNFTREYFRVTTRDHTWKNEVIVELYHICVHLNSSSICFVNVTLTEFDEVTNSRCLASMFIIMCSITVCM